jgi:SAM-dependent methyltransferase
MDDYSRANRAVWNAWTAHHAGSEHHRDAERVRAGGSSLRSIELEEVGAVAGRTLLHLQCNMGSDTLSWARLGARVTGVDIADGAIAKARALALEAGIEARFVCSDVYDLPAALDEQFDIVFTSYGALCWMPDLSRWAEIAARYVRPGGVFYIVDLHPFPMIFDSGRQDPTGMRFEVASPYFHAAEPIAAAVEPGSAGADEDAPATVYAWRYSLGEVISALLAAGLQLEFVHEFPMAHYRCFPELVRGEDGWWRWPDGRNSMPLLFSIKARQDEESTEVTRGAGGQEDGVQRSRRRGEATGGSEPNAGD